MELEEIKQNLNNFGYCIVPNVINQPDINYCKDLFFQWKDKIPNHNFLHKSIDPHGIYKYFNVGHTQMAWYLRTRPEIQNIFKYLWDTNDLVVSFDGCCYISKDNQQKDNCWTHTDQASNNSDLQCYQGFIALTTNRERTLVIYEGSHLLHKDYFKEKNINNSKNWNIICPKYLENIKENKKILNIPAGSLVLWDSRVFHQNQYGKPNSEERLVQYICYLPKNNPKNSSTMQSKRQHYFINKRTTSHWPYPIKVNSLQPQTYGDNSKIINYDQIPNDDLSLLQQEIDKLL